MESQKDLVAWAPLTKLLDKVANEKLTRAGAKDTQEAKDAQDSLNSSKTKISS